MSQEDVQSLQSVDSIGLGDLDHPEGSLPEEEDGDEEAGDLDPRVQVELEKLNEATELINKYEAQLDEARAAGRHAFCEMTRKLQELAEQLGKCIPKARPYYEARVELKKAQTELQQAALMFEKANASLKASKEIVRLTEEGLTRQGCRLDETWQEMLNYATRKVAQCEGDVRLRQRDHWTASKLCAEGEIKVRLLEKKFKSAIFKSKSYYELRSQMNHFVEKEKLRVHQLEQSIAHAKSAYSEGLSNLEGISEQIHLKRRRKDETEQRDSGCGTISDSASVTGSLDVDSLHLHPLHPLHPLYPLHPLASEERLPLAAEGRSPLVTEGRPLGDSVGHSVGHGQSYPLLSALEKELSRLQVEGKTKIAPKKRVLETVTSVDSAVDSGEECEDFDAPNDETINGLDFEGTVVMNF